MKLYPAFLSVLLAGSSGLVWANAPVANPPAVLPANTSEAPRELRYDAKRVLTKGMSAADIRKVMGEPAEIRPFKADKWTAEIWVYRRSRVVDTRQEATSTRPVPHVDPVSKEVVVVNEPVYSAVNRIADETTELLIFENRLAEWKQTLTESRQFN